MRKNEVNVSKKKFAQQYFRVNPPQTDRIKKYVNNIVVDKTVSESGPAVQGVLSPYPKKKKMYLYTYYTRYASSRHFES